MSWAWTRTFYASRNGTIFNFEAKRQRDDAVQNHGFSKVLSAEAMKHYPNITRVGWRDYGKFIADAYAVNEVLHKTLQTRFKDAPTIIPADKDGADDV